MMQETSLELLPTMQALYAEAPDLAVVLDKVIIHPAGGSGGRCCRITNRVVFSVFGAMGAWFGFTLFLRPALQLKGKAWRITSAVGSVAAGVFPLRSWIDIGESWSQERCPEEKQLRYRYRHQAVRVIKTVTDYAWGVFTQFPTLEIVFNFNKHPGLAPMEGICTLLAVSSPTIESSQGLTSGIEAGARRVFSRYISRNQQRRVMLKIQDFIQGRVKERMRQGLRMSREERVARFSALYHQELSIQSSQLEQLRLLCRQMVLTRYEDHAFTVQAPMWHRCIDWLIQIVMGLLTVILADLMQTSGMTRDSAHIITDDEAATDVLQVLVCLSWLYISAVGPGAVAAKVYRQCTDAFSVPREKTFAELYYPRMSKLGDALAVTVSWLMLGENIEIGAPYFNEESRMGRVLLAGDVIACTGYFMDAMSALSESAIETFARSRWAGEDERHAIEFRDRCQRMLEILSEVSTPDLQALLRWTGDDELSSYIREHALSEEDLVHLALNSV